VNALLAVPYGRITVLGRADLENEATELKAQMQALTEHRDDS